MTEDETVGWHHRLGGHEFEQAPAIGDGQGSLACCSPLGCKETWLSDWTELRVKVKIFKCNWFPSPKEREDEKDGALWKIPGVCLDVICQCAKQQGFHLLTDIHAWLLPPVHCWYLALNLTHHWIYKGICFFFFCNFCSCLSPTDVAPARQSAAQTMRACLFILQFPASHSPLLWSNKRNSLKELSAWLLSEEGKQIELFLPTEVFHNSHWSQLFPHLQ